MENQILQLQPQQPSENTNSSNCKVGGQSEPALNLSGSKAQSNLSTPTQLKQNQLNNKVGLNNQQILMAGNNYLPASLQQPIRLLLTEIIPQAVVSDTHHFIEAVFTSECIGDLRRSGYIHEISKLKDKIIYVSKWSLQIDYTDSQFDYHSFENFKIRIVIEQFHPKTHEQFNKNLLKSAFSIYRSSEKIQPLMKNFRHWFYQTLIYKSAWSNNDTVENKAEQKQQAGQRRPKKDQTNYNQLCGEIKMPSLKEVLFQQSSNPNKSNASHFQSNQKSSEFDNNLQLKSLNTANLSHNSQNTTQQSLHDHLINSSNTLNNFENLSQENSDFLYKFGGQIQNSQVFRYKQQDFQNQGCFKDIDSDLEEFKEQILLKKKLQGKDYHENDIQRIFLTELGELQYDIKQNKKKSKWLDEVQDEKRREQIKLNIKYFQINSEYYNIKNSIVTQEERELYAQQFRNSRKLIGYTIERSVSSIRQGLINMMNKKSNYPLLIGKKKARPRANSQENITQHRDESQHEIINPTLKTFKREGLSQNVYYKNNDMDNETQSERSDMDSELEGQLKMEKQCQLRQCQANIKMFGSYLEWMEKFKIASLQSFQRIMDPDQQGKSNNEIIKNEIKVEKPVVKARANEHRNSRKLTKYVDDEDDEKYFFKQQQIANQQVKVEKQKCQDEKMEFWSDEDDGQIIQNSDSKNIIQMETQNQNNQDQQIPREIIKNDNEEMQDLENELNIQSSSNNQLNLIADSSSSNNQNVLMVEQYATPKLTYRPPFIEPPLFEPKMSTFVFTYNIPAPIPPKPIEQMNLHEKFLFDMEIEEYNNEKDIQEKKERQIHIKQQRELFKQDMIKAEENRNYERNNMPLWEILSRQAMKDDDNQKLIKKQKEAQKQQQTAQHKIISSTQIAQQMQKQSLQVTQQRKIMFYYRQQSSSEQSEQNNQFYIEKESNQNNESDKTESEVMEESDIGSPQRQQNSSSDKIINRRNYVEKMTKQFGKVIDREISKCSHRDMQVRDYKSKNNSDKRHDILKVYKDKEKRNERFVYNKQRFLSDNVTPNDQFDEESMRSPKFQSIEDAEKEMNNRVYPESDDKQTLDENVAPMQKQIAGDHDFPSFNIDEQENGLVEIQQVPLTQDYNQNEGQEDEWDEPNEEPNESNHKYGENEIDDDQNESYGDQKSDDQEDIIQNEGVEDPHLFENQEIKQEQDVVEILSSHSQDQQDSEEEVQEILAQNNYRNNNNFQQPPNIYKKSKLIDNSQYSQQRQSPSTPPQYQQTQSYGNLKPFSANQNKNAIQNVKSYQQSVPSEYKNKQPLISQSPNRGFNKNVQGVVEQDKVSQKDNGYSLKLEQMKSLLHKIKLQINNTNQQNNFDLKQHQQKIQNEIINLEKKLSFKNIQIQNINDPKIFKGRQNYNQPSDQRIQQSDRNQQFENEPKKSMSPSKNTPHFPVNSQKQGRRPEYFEQQTNFNTKTKQMPHLNQVNLQPSSYKNYHYQTNSMQQFKNNQKLQNDQVYEEQEEEGNPIEELDQQDYFEMENEDGHLGVPEQEQLLIEQEEDDYPLPSFGSQVKHQDSGQDQRNKVNTISSGNKRIHRSKSPENVQTAYRVQPFSINDQEDEADQDQQEMELQDQYQMQSASQQKMNPEHYISQNVGSKRNYQQYQQNNLRNRSRSLSQTRPSETSSKPINSFANQNNEVNNSYYQGQNYGYGKGIPRGSQINHQSQRQLEKDVDYRNLSEFAASQLIKSHIDNVQQLGKQQEIKYLEKQMDQKQKYLQQLQQREAQQLKGNLQNHQQMEDYYQQDQEGDIYQQQMPRGDKINKQLPNKMGGNVVPSHLKRPQQQQNLNNKHFSDYQLSEQSKQNPQRPRQNNQITPQQIQALQQQYIQKSQNPLRSSQTNSQHMNQVKPVIPQQMRPSEQIQQKKLQPLIPGTKRVMNNSQIGLEKFEDKNQILNQNNISSGKAHNSSSTKKNISQIVIDDHQIQGDKIIQNNQQKQLMQDQQYDIRKLQGVQQVKILPQNQNSGNMIGFGNKRMYVQNPMGMQNESYAKQQQFIPKKEFRQDPQKIPQKFIMQNGSQMGGQFPKQNEKQKHTQYNQNQGEEPMRVKQQQMNQKYQKHMPQVDLVDGNYEECQYPQKRRRME